LSIRNLLISCLNERPIYHRWNSGILLIENAVTLEGDANGAPHPEPSAYAAKFKGKYAHHTITGEDWSQPAARSTNNIAAFFDHLIKVYFGQLK
jgi:hypothetical protein